MPTLPASPHVRHREWGPLDYEIVRARDAHTREVEALVQQQARIAQGFSPTGEVLQRKQSPYGPPGYSPLTGFGFTPSSYQGPMSAADAIRLGQLIHGPGASGLYRSAYGAGNDGNSAVFACLQAICLSFPQAPARVYKGNPDSPDAIPAPDHPLEDLLDVPNPDMTAPEMWYGVQYAKHVDGNMYWVKIASEAGNPVEVWPISPLTMFPVTTREDLADSRRRHRISYYIHTPAPGEYYRYEKDEVIHFRLGQDLYDPRLGCGPLKHLVREVAGDDEAVEFTRSLLQNSAVPGLVATIPPEQSRGFTREKAQELKADIETAFRAGNRGRVGVLTAGADLKQYGFSPDQLNLEVLHRVPEERISAVLRVPAIIAGLGAGLDRSSFSNFREARHAFMDMCLVPLYTFDSATLNQQLLVDFAPRRRYFIRFDTSQIQALKEDENQLWARLDNAFKSGWSAASEVRVRAGLPPEMPDDGIKPQQPATPLPVLPATEDARRNGSSNIIANPAVNGSARRN